jgi:hypothetical protein
MMDSLLQGLPNVAVYLDDILITGQNEQQHWKLYWSVKRAGLKLKQSKCVFMSPDVEYLG